MLTNPLFLVTCLIRSGGHVYLISFVLRVGKTTLFNLVRM